MHLPPSLHVASLAEALAEELGDQTLEETQRWGKMIRKVTSGELAGDFAKRLRDPNEVLDGDKSCHGCFRMSFAKHSFSHSPKQCHEQRCPLVWDPKKITQDI